MRGAEAPLWPHRCRGRLLRCQLSWWWRLLPVSQHLAARKQVFPCRNQKRPRTRRDASQARQIFIFHRTRRKRNRKQVQVSRGHVQIAGRTRVRRRFLRGHSESAAPLLCTVWRHSACALAFPIISSYRVPAGLSKRGQKVLSVTLPAVLQWLSARD